MCSSEQRLTVLNLFSIEPKSAQLGNVASCDHQYGQPLFVNHLQYIADFFSMHSQEMKDKVSEIIPPPLNVQSPVCLCVCVCMHVHVFLSSLHTLSLFTMFHPELDLKIKKTVKNSNPFGSHLILYLDVSCVFTLAGEFLLFKFCR